MPLKYNKNELKLLLGYSVSTYYKRAVNADQKQHEKSNYTSVLLYMNIFRIFTLSGLSGIISSILLYQLFDLYNISLTLSFMTAAAVIAFYTNPYQRRYPFAIYQRVLVLQSKLAATVQQTIYKRTNAFLLFQIAFFCLFEMPLALLGVKLLMH